MARMDKHSSGFDCKFGANCVKFNPNNIENANMLKRLMSSLSEKELFSWELVPELFRLFKHEHTRISNISNFKLLSNEWKKHFIDYLIIRTSCNNGELYKSAYTYYNSINLQKNKAINKDVLINDSTFYYNYEEKEDFSVENQKPVKSYMTKMYADEVRNKNTFNMSRRAANRDQVIEDSGAGSTTQAKYIVVRGKTTYAPAGFTFSGEQFNTVMKRIKSGELTSTCSTGDTKIDKEKPSASTNTLMNTTFDEKCKCGKYHINTLAYEVWKSASTRYTYDSSSGWIKYGYSAAEEADNQKHFLAKNSSGDKLNGTLNGATNGTGNLPANGGSGGSGDGSGSGGTDTSGGSTGGDMSMGATTSTAPDYGDPGLFGANSGDTKDLAMYINASASTGGGEEGVSGENSVTQDTNADLAKTANNNDYAANPSNPLNATINNNTNAPGSSAVGQGNNPNNQNQGNKVPGYAANPSNPLNATINNNTNAPETQQTVGTDSTGSTASTAASAPSTLSSADVEEAIKGAGFSVYNAAYSMYGGGGDSLDGSVGQGTLDFIPAFKDGSHSHKTSIMGIPMMYNALADPNGRIYSETTMMDLPIIYIEPGRGIINNTLDASLMDELKDAYKGVDDGGSIKTAETMEDLRALSFENALIEYLEYFQNIASIVYANMGLGVFKWQDSLAANNNIFSWFKGGGKTDDGNDTNINTLLNRSLIFFADTATSVSDSFSNEFSDAPVTSSINNFGVLVRNFKMMAFQDAAQQAFNDRAQGIVANFQDQSDTGKNRNTLEGIINDILTKGATLWNGSQVLFPQVWNDSRHDRSYSLSFKFFSPYGNKESIFNNVYMPVLALMTLTLPRMDGISGYAQPFYVRVNAPGYSN